MLGNGPHFKWTLENDSKVEGEDTIWSQLMVVTASHYEAVRCAGLKKAAMIILIENEARKAWRVPAPKNTVQCPVQQFQRQDTNNKQPSGYN